MGKSSEQKGHVSGFATHNLSALIGSILVLLVLAAPVQAAERSKSSFNHQSTGFPLTGAHAQQECQTCHVRGIFKGTPNRCESCHIQGSRLGNTAKPANHVATNQGCAVCHSSTTTWRGARFSHAEVKPGACTTCHGITATGKSANHVPTTASCDTCHRTTAWVPASGGALPNGHRPVLAGNACSACHAGGTYAFRHPNVTTGCASCHNGVYARAKLNNAIHNFAGTNTCETCHKNTTTFTGSRIFSHTSVTPGQCANCHNGTNLPALGKPNGHVTTAESCDTCHRTTAWLPATGGALPIGHRPVVAGTACSTCHVGGASAFTHPNVASGCASCHNGVNARAKLNNAIHNFAGTNTCETCHKNTTAFTGAVFSHTSVTPGQCANCHNGANPPALGKPNGHVTTTAACDSCHRTTAWTPATGGALPNGHRPVVAGTACSTCHVGGASAFTHPKVASGCASCHNGVNARAKLNNAIHNFAGTNTCETCHKNTTAFTGAVFSHTSVTPGQCANCHNGANPPARGQPSPPAHVATTQTCDTCHRTAAWIPATFSHTGPGIAGNCISCHNGSTATGKNKKPNHVQTTAQCDTCHRTTSWIPSTFSHSTTPTAGLCDTCHNGTSATGKNAKLNHIATTAQCDACHRTTAWVPATFNHALANTANNCISCHNGTSATGKPSGHFVTQRQCDQCHTTNPPWSTVRHTHTSPSYFAHSSGVGCRACHVGGNEVITWKFSAYSGTCAGCHATDYKAGDHIKTRSPGTITYTVAELKNCAGSCHEYTDNTFTKILRSRSGQHRPTGGGF